MHGIANLFAVEGPVAAATSAVYKNKLPQRHHFTECRMVAGMAGGCSYATARV